MLKEWEKSEKPSEEEIKARLEAVKEKLARQQLLIDQACHEKCCTMGGSGNRSKSFLREDRCVGRGLKQEIQRGEKV